MLFSVICRHAATSALASIACWLVCAIFISLIAGIVANAIFPVGDNSDVTAQINNYTLNLGLNRISPYYLFSEAASTIMNPSVRSINVVTMESLSGAISGYLSFGQSLLLVWPHLTALLAGTLIAFAISYVNFMRQEIRS
jgi:ABC-2 type transport system permease protein